MGVGQLLYRSVMTAVFVHGVPETAHIWDRLSRELARTDCVALKLPGFGYLERRGATAMRPAF